MILITCTYSNNLSNIQKNSDGPSINNDKKKKEKNNITDNCSTPKRKKNKTKGKAISKPYVLYSSQQEFVKTSEFSFWISLLKSVPCQV